MNARGESRPRQTTLLKAIKEVLYKTDSWKFIRKTNGNVIVDHLENVRAQFGKTESNASSFSQFLWGFVPDHSRHGYVLDVFIIVIVEKNLGLIFRGIPRRSGLRDHPRLYHLWDFPIAK